MKGVWPDCERKFIFTIGFGENENRNGNENGNRKDASGGREGMIPSRTLPDGNGECRGPGG
jgi:hypothetical protein